MPDELLRKRLLLVDDEIGIRLTLPRILSKHGFDVTSVASLEDAVNEIQTDSFDALLSDLNLPVPNSSNDVTIAGLIQRVEQTTFPGGGAESDEQTGSPEA